MAAGPCQVRAPAHDAPVLLLLQAENKALKDEVARLKEALCSMQPSAGGPAAAFNCIAA